MTPEEGMALVSAGYVPATSWEEGDALWCRAVARGRIIERITDGTRGRYATWAHLVEHPDLGPGEVFAIFSNATHSILYRCSPEAARAAILHPSAFNLA